MFSTDRNFYNYTSIKTQAFPYHTEDSQKPIKYIENTVRANEPQFSTRSFGEKGDTALRPALTNLRDIGRAQTGAPCEFGRAPLQTRHIFGETTDTESSLRPAHTMHNKLRDAMEIPRFDPSDRLNFTYPIEEAPRGGLPTRDATRTQFEGL